MSTRNQRGAALIETAITIPLLLLIAVGIFEFGRAYQTWQVLTNASREGARHAVTPGAQDADVTALVTNYMKNGALEYYANAVVNVERNVALPAGAGSRITIQYPFQFMVLQPVARLVVPGTNTGQAITMTVTALMRNEAP